MSKVKVGLITTMAEDDTWPEHFVEEFKRKHLNVQKAIEGLGFEVTTASSQLGRRFRQMIEQAKVLREKDVDVLLLFVPDWTYSSNCAVAGLNTGVPVIVWADDSPGHSGIVGGSIVRGGLDEIGVKNTLIHGSIENKDTLDRVATWCIGIAGATRLRNKKIGIGGSRSMGMYTAPVDPSEIMKKFGVDIDGWEQVELLRRAEKLPDSDTDRMYDWMLREFGKIEVKDEVLKAQIRMYLALVDLIKEKEYDAVCVKCLPDMPACHTTFCLAISILNDLSDHRGTKESIVCGCEADVNGTLTMQILKNLNGGPVMFADVQRLYREKNEIGLMNCGSSATDFAKSKKEVYWVKEGLKEFDWKMGAACPQYITRSGKVTLARLGRIDGEYVMLILGGEAVEYPRDKLKDLNPQHPQSYIKLDCNLDKFIENLRCNHIHFIFGDHYEELNIACQVLDIRPITI